MPENKTHTLQVTMVDTFKLQGEYKRGFGVDTLEQARKFYLIINHVALKENPAHRVGNWCYPLLALI